MKFGKQTLAAFIGVALIFTFPLLAQKEGSGSCEKACGIPDLTPEQTAKIQKLRIDHQKTILALQPDLKTKRLELRQMMMEGADQKKLEAKIDELAKAGADFQKKRLAHRNEIRSLLTDEQKKIFNQTCSSLDCGAASGQGRCGASGCGDHRGGSKEHHGGVGRDAGCKH
jgi:Spy/CpxP family protein refolding chaperone